MVRRREIVHRYDKLVRDKIPKHITQRGGRAQIHVASRKEYWNKLKEKLLEEAKEFVVRGSLEELADVQEVVAAILTFKRIPRIKLQRVQRKKAAAKGRFRKRIILERA